MQVIADEQGLLRVSSPSPARTVDCHPGDCADADADGLIDAWEDQLLYRLNPLVNFEWHDQVLQDPNARVGAIGRVARGPEPDHLRVFIVLTFSSDYGRCGLGRHNGDNERVAFDLLLAPPEQHGGDATVLAVYTAAHEYSSVDHGAVWDAASLLASGRRLTTLIDDLTGDPRWVVVAGQDSHALYIDEETCGSASPIACQNDECNRGEPDFGDPNNVLFPIVNVGEAAHPRVDDLGPIGFPGESAWDDRDFCGGLGGSTCTPPMRVKLLVDPFAIR
jgi:hypothetical protein